MKTRYVPKKRSGLKLPGILLAIIILAGTLYYELASGNNQAVFQSSDDGGLIINEFMASGNRTAVDEDGDFSDWIEIYNSGDSPVNLKDYGLSDTQNAPNKWVFPNVVLEPKEYLLVFASGKDRRDPENGYLHTNFKIGASKDEVVYLSNPRGQTLDQTQNQNIQPGCSLGRSTENPTVWQAFEKPTPGFPNTEEGYAQYQASRRIDNSPVVINEVMASNQITLMDEDGDYSDWIEIYNSGDSPVNLAGYGLSDDPNNLYKWKIPDITLDPKSYLVIFASGKDREGDTPGYYHTNFKINSMNESVYLSNNQGQIINDVSFGELDPDSSYGREAENMEKWTIFSKPTPGFENTEEGYNQLQEQVSLNNPGIFINEVMMSNQSVITDEDGEYNDWIELYNASDSPINLKDYSLSDNTKKVSKWRFPDITLEPKQYMLVFASGKDRTDVKKKYLHTNFRLALGGEALVMADPSGKIIDKMQIGQFPVDMSYGRDSQQSGYLIFKEPTPGEPNNGTGYKNMAKSPEFSQPGGFYKNQVSVSLSSPSKSAVIRYTLDGSEPTEKSKVYTSPISLTKTTVVRAKSFEEGQLPSFTATNTYFVNDTHTLTVVSVSTDPDNLWDEQTGIFVKGPNADSEFPYKGANFWQHWEKPIHIELYEPDGTQGFSIDAGMRVFGAYSRAMDQKSLSIFARKEYGTERIEYPLFSQKPNLTSFKSLVLRTSGQDAQLSKIRDAMMTSLIAGYMDVDYQAYRPAIVYINGEYWGVYNIREKINEHFIADNHNIENPDNIDIIEANRRVRHGDSKHYDALYEFVETHDLKVKENYEYVKTQMDVQNYMDYIIAEIYFGNTDTGNIRFWHERTPTGKWRWILYDLDWGFFTVDHDSVWYAINPAGTGVGKMFSNLLIRKLLENPTFRDEFLHRFAYHLNNTFKKERVIQRIDEMARTIEPEMPRQVEKWGSSMESWKRNIDRLKNFAEKRHGYLYQYIQKNFHLSNAEMQEIFGVIP